MSVMTKTDDGVTFTEEHFGSAKFYLLYAINLETGELNYVDKIYNTSPQEQTHGDPKKAKSVSELMQNVHVLVGSAMGPNIVRIESAMEKLKDKLDVIKRNLEMPPEEDREIIYIG